MEYRTGNDGSCREVYLNGSFKFNDNEVFREIVHDMENASGKPYVFDLGGLEFIDSAGLGMLLIAKKTAEKNDIGLILRGAHGQVQHMLQVTKFDTLIECEN